MVQQRAPDRHRRWRRAIAAVTLAAGAQFLVVTFALMALYPAPYSFVGNYFSDLGITVTHGGVPNPLCSRLFTATTVGAGALLVPFWVAMGAWFPPGRGHGLARVGTALGLLSSPLLMGVGLIPGDLYLTPHNVCAQSFFVVYALAMVLFGVAMLRSGGAYPRTSAIPGFVVFGIAIFHVVTSPDMAAPLTQKLSVYGFIAWSAYQAAIGWPAAERRQAGAGGSADGTRG